MLLLEWLENYFVRTRPKTNQKVEDKKIIISDGVENNLEKAENGGCQHFLTFSKASFFKVKVMKTRDCVVKTINLFPNDKFWTPLN